MNFASLLCMIPGHNWERFDVVDESRIKYIYFKCRLCGKIKWGRETEK